MSLSCLSVRRCSGNVLRMIPHTLGSKQRAKCSVFQIHRVSFFAAVSSEDNVSHMSCGFFGLSPVLLSPCLSEELQPPSVPA